MHQSSHSLLKMNNNNRNEVRAADELDLVDNDLTVGISEWDHDDTSSSENDDDDENKERNNDVEVMSPPARDHELSHGLGLMNLYPHGRNARRSLDWYGRRELVQRRPFIRQTARLLFEELQLFFMPRLAEETTQAVDDWTDETTSSSDEEEKDGEEQDQPAAAAT